MTESKCVDELADFYRSPSPNRVVACLENKMLSADDSWWTGRDPFHTRVVAEVPRAAYQEPRGKDPKRKQENRYNRWPAEPRASYA